MEKKTEKVCMNCRFIKRPFGRNLHDSFYCQKHMKFIVPIQTNSCEFWKEYHTDEVIDNL